MKLRVIRTDTLEGAEYDVVLVPPDLTYARERTLGALGQLRERLPKLSRFTLRFGKETDDV